MTYTIKFGTEQNYPSAWRTHMRGGELFVSNSQRLTPKIKMAILSHVCAAAGIVGPTDSKDANDLWEKLPITKWDNVMVRPIHVVNDEDPTDYRVGVDYSHSMGMGELRTEQVHALA